MAPALRYHRVLLLTCFMSLPSACTGQAAPTMPPSHAEPVEPRPLGTFEGYAEADDRFPTPLVLTIDTVGRDGQVQGTFRVGVKVDPLPDPPPGLQHGDTAAIASMLFEGYPYTLRAGRLDGKRLRFGFNGYEPFASWCSRQRPVDHGGDSWSCAPGSFRCSGGKCYSGTTDGEAHEVDPTAAELCSRQVCRCDRNSCTAGEGMAAMFDMVLQGDELDGSMRSGPGSVRVRFARTTVRAHSEAGEHAPDRNSPPATGPR